MASYFIRLNGKVVGPLETGRIRQLLMRGRCDGDTPVSIDRSRWVLLREAIDIGPLSEPSAPPPRAVGTDEPRLRPAEAPSGTGESGSAGLRPFIISICPVCQHRFRLTPEQQSSAEPVLCPACGHVYPISAGSPPGGGEPPRVVPFPSVPSAAAAEKRSGGMRLVIAIVAAIVVVLLFAAAGAGVFRWHAGSRTPAEETLRPVSEQYRRGVGVVVAMVVDRNGNRYPCPVGTAFAVAPGHFVTDTQAAQDIRRAPEQVSQKLYSHDSGSVASKEFRVDSVEIRLSDSGGEAFAVKQIQLPREFQKTTERIIRPDVAVLIIQGRSEVCFPRASSGELETLTAGRRVAFLGFPLDQLRSGDGDLADPVARYAEGKLQSQPGSGSAEVVSPGETLFSHNIPARNAGGSPVFLEDGRVIGIVSGWVPPGSTGVCVRIDRLDGIGDPVEIAEFVRN